MNIQEIVKDIHYVGVNDRVKHKFEALWPLPYGVSYNSYIVAGDEKVALIDCVSITEVREFFNNIERIAGTRSIDYLVVNHMEPDHSGSIPEIVRAYPDIKIVGNSKTIDMIRGFYHIDDPARFHEVKDGDKLDLGGRSLTFYLTPMVHWPETMMTYVEDSGVLFSGDAFGTFGALNGAVIDRDMDTDVYIREMYRYYSNIVGKYGRFVEKALAKLSGLKLTYICSTHGPVWNEKIGEVSEIYSRLAGYKSEPGVVIVYGSMYGNTAEIAEMIARELAAKGVKKIIIHNASHSDMSDMITDAFRYQTLIVGSATYSMRLFPPVETFMNAMETREIKNKVFGTFGNYTWAAGVVTTKLVEFCERMKIPVTASLIVKQSANENTSAQVKEFAENIFNAMNSDTPEEKNCNCE
ncbi:MAG: FprA family A-type flavoprotein [Muribaculaceae bacterium]|nr:FprA family A-type flavoprotein [Muribaculaceae bacterium]